MQAPLYESRKLLLESFNLEAKNPASRWSVHGMRDICATVSGMISQLALSFVGGFKTEPTILWWDLRDGSMYTTHVGEIHRCPADTFKDYKMPTNREASRYEFSCGTSKRKIYVGHDDTWRQKTRQFGVMDIGWDMDLCAGLGLGFIPDDFGARLDPSIEDLHTKLSKASTVRFVPNFLLWLDSDGQIHAIYCEVHKSNSHLH